MFIFVKLLLTEESNLSYMQTVKIADNWIRSELNGFVTAEEARNFSLLIFNHLRGYERKDMLLNQDVLLTNNEVEFISNSLCRLKNSEPIQYVLGYTEFYGLKFKTDKRALIPRPETEELVDWVIENSKNNQNILDVGTGSGCIAVALKKHLPQASVYGWDISPQALQLADENAQLNGVEVSFKLQDVLSVQLETVQWLDLLVSNPPYVTLKEKEAMLANVLEFEPHNALFVSNNEPLLFYEVIAKLGTKILKSGGQLYFEINESFGSQTKELLSKLGYSSISLKKDLFGKDRMVRALWA